MSLGTAFGGQCYPTQAAAARAFCSGFFMSDTSANTYACTAVASTFSETAGGAVTGNWTKTKTGTGGGTSSSQAPWTFQSCETYGYDYFQPYIAAFVPAAVAVLCGKWLYRFFAQDREVV